MKTQRHDTKIFYEKLAGLNPAQRLAVNTTEGPVMVVAGPGTGKTQVLVLRIANILDKTDTDPSSILCLTFTRSGVTAMQNRLEEYIGSTARNVTITTFHSFAISLVEKYYDLLDFSHVPELLDDTVTVMIVDEILENNHWEYLRPRTDSTKYFKDIKGLISILKRERISPEQFLSDIEQEIKNISLNPDNLSSRGPTKGQLKQEAVKRIEGLRRTTEVVTFYYKYEDIKRERNLMDYDDVLTYAVELAEKYENVRADIAENYQYVLVDEHQDSSGVQNAFLRAVWHDIEQPNIFVVGDDRQLIYGFSGANLDYFTEFKTLFGRAVMITLTENYRSTAPILAVADELLQSSVTTESLHSNTIGNDKIILSSFVYGRDEIIGAGLYFKKQIESGIDPNTCALLLPKNYQVKNAVQILRTMGIPVVSEQAISLLQLPASTSMLRILHIITNPHDSVSLSYALLDMTSLVPPMQAHVFIKSLKKPDTLTIDDMISSADDQGMFAHENKVVIFGKKLHTWVETLSHERVSHIVSIIGNELLIDQSKNYDVLIQNVEIVRSFIHAAASWEDKNPTGTLADFLNYFHRLNTYGNTVSVAHLSNNTGVRVMTLHKSKGLEYDHVWIGHMNQEILMSEKQNAFMLPESIMLKIAERDTLTARRELYVAITRAKQFCTISFAETRDTGGDMQLAHIITDLSDEHFIKVTSSENQDIILAHNPRYYAPVPLQAGTGDIMTEIRDLVRDRFIETKISVSMLNNFFECPWKWYFRNFLKLPETKSVSLALGSAVHSTIEYILKEKTLPSEKLIQEKILLSLRHEQVHDSADIVRLSVDAYNAVRSFIDGYYKQLANDRTAERSISYRDKQFPNLSIYGKIDLTERHVDGSIVVSDFKTGTSKTTGVIEKMNPDGRLSDYMRQLAMYSYLIRGAEGNDVSESRLLFLEEDQKNKNALYRTHITSKQIDLLIRDIADYQEYLHTGDWINRPCNAKSYGNSTVGCEYCARMERLMGAK